MDYHDPEVPKVVSRLIEKMLDEDCTNPEGTAEAAAQELLDRALAIGREGQFKEAMKFWKHSDGIPEDVLWQWFSGVYKGVKSNARRNKPKSRKGKGRKPKR